MAMNPRSVWRLVSLRITMHNTAKQIREALKAEGIGNRLVSVACKPSYQIHVRTKFGALSTERVMEIVEKCYYAKPHSWLCCWVDGKMLGMANISR